MTISRRAALAGLTALEFLNLEGTQVSDVNALIKQFSQMREMMRKMGKFQKMMSKMGGAGGLMGKMPFGR